jgi:hypothetical protein
MSDENGGENPNLLTEDEYMSLLTIRERAMGRRAAVKRGEIVYAPDMSYTFSHFGVLPVRYAEYWDGKVFEVVAEGSRCTDSPSNEHIISKERKRWCIMCYRTVYDYRDGGL